MSPAPPSGAAPSGARPCPICRQPRKPEHAPFCSTRCKDRDLVRWFSDSYAVPGRPAEPDDFARGETREDD